MDDTKPRSSVHLTKFGWIWLGLLLVCFGAGWILEWFDHSTELVPDHDDALEFGFIAAAIVAAISVPMIFLQSKGSITGRLVMSLIVAPIFALLGIATLTIEASTLVLKSRDFPSARTRTFDGLLLVQRAYQTHGKGRSWNIQTTPIWSNLDITEADYKFMLAHRAPGDLGHDSNEITSRGYFCARVTLQQADQALRVLNSGTYKLPSGTVGICAELEKQYPDISVIQ